MRINLLWEDGNKLPTERNAAENPKGSVCAKYPMGMPLVLHTLSHRPPGLESAPETQQTRLFSVERLRLLALRLQIDYRCQGRTTQRHICWHAALSLAAFEDLEGRVVRVTDGDTLTLLDNSCQQYRIRLAGVDAPEKGQPYGQRSKQHLADLAFGKEARADCYKVDRYGRNVCKREKDPYGSSE